MTIFGRVLAAAALAVVAAGAGAQEFPQRAVTIVVPFAPGGQWDIVGRQLAGTLTPILGQPVIIENIGGGTTVIGTQRVARAEPDGHTLLLASPPFAINPSQMDSLPYDTVEAFEPVSLLISPAYVMAVHPALGVSSVAELIEVAQADPDRINFGSPGVGSGVHLGTELFMLRAGIEMTHVPYSGGGEAITDLLANRIQLFFGNLTTMLPYVNAGELVALAVSSSDRSSMLPDLPTVAEAGVEGYANGSWGGILAPAGTPPEIIEVLNTAIVQAVHEPAFADAMRADGVEPIGSTPQVFRDFIASEITTWEEVLATITLD